MIQRFIRLDVVWKLNRWSGQNEEHYWHRVAAVQECDKKKAIPGFHIQVSPFSMQYAHIYPWSPASCFREPSFNISLQVIFSGEDAMRQSLLNFYKSSGSVPDFFMFSYCLIGNYLSQGSFCLRDVSGVAVTMHSMDKNKRANGIHMARIKFKSRCAAERITSSRSRAASGCSRCSQSRKMV